MNKYNERTTTLMMGRSDKGFERVKLENKIERTVKAYAQH